MFVGCFEININVTVKHVQHVEVILTCSLPWVDLLSFSVPEGTEKIAGLWFARNISTQANTDKCDNLTSLESQIVLYKP